MELFPPGGLVTREEGRSVMTLPQFKLLALAKMLFEHFKFTSAFSVE